MELFFDSMREFTPASTFFRITLAVVLGGAVGIERGRKHRAAGFRTYMMVSMGACLAMMLSQYLNYCINTLWAERIAQLSFNVTTDMVRFGAQCVSGIGFLGAGTIIITSTRQVKGLTTAAGLWVSSCMGIAMGAGMFEGACLAFLLVIFTTTVLSKVEFSVVSTAPNMDMYVEFEKMDDLGTIISFLKKRGIHIFDVEVGRLSDSENKHPNAVFSIRLPGKTRHATAVADLSSLSCVTTIEEL